MKRLLFFCLLLFFIGCLGYPDHVVPVMDFNLEQYLGKWYEIARLDHSFERGLEQVTAEYSMREDGGVRVLNRGFSVEKNEWKEAEGKAYFVQDANIGYLKVSFFGPFYGSYVIFGLDHKNHQYAFVSGPNLSYLWFLSRTPTVRDSLMKQFVHQAKELGFSVEELIYVNQAVE